jgi:MFS family permease
VPRANDRALPAITAALSLSPSDGPFIVACSLVASAFGGVTGGTLADRFGRVRVLTFVIVGYSVFAALTATAQNFEQLLFWRICHGFAFGAEWAVGAALLAEYAGACPRSCWRSAGRPWSAPPPTAVS